MKVAIIGAGNVGRAVAAAATRAGHDVRITARHTERAQEAAQATGARLATSNVAAARDADVVVLAVPVTAIDEVADELKETVTGKTLVDAINRPTPDPTGTPDVSVAETLQAKLPQARVVKALNTVLASRAAEPVVDGERLDGYVAGDDETAKSTVMELLRSIGFRPLDVGPLATARTLEGMAWLNIELNMRNNWPWQDGWKLVGATGS